jgi:O-antigen/teichoic acid export membrane protein
MGVGLVRFLPGAKSPERLLNSAFTFNIVAACLASGIFLTGLSLWSPSLTIIRQEPLYTAGFLVYTVAATLGSTVRLAFVAHRQAFYTLLHTSVVNGGRLLLIVALTKLGAAGLVGSVMLSTVLAVALSLSRLLPQVALNYRPRPQLSWPDLAEIIPYSVGNYVALLTTQTSQMVAPLIALEILGAASSGYTYIAWMLGFLLTSPGLALANSAFAEGSHSPQKLSTILPRAAAAGLVLTLPTATVLGVAAPQVLLLFGPSYAQEASGLLRWMAAAAPLAVLTGLYFTRLRVQKRIGHLMFLGCIVAIATLGSAVLLMPHVGISASGIGWMVGNGLVTALAVVNMWKETSRTHGKENQSMPTERKSNPRRAEPVVVAAIPCYNESRFIEDVVRRSQSYVDAVVVVDDGSSDDTAELARAAGAQTLLHPINMGPGAAARDCLQLGLDMQADVLVTLDGDGQHNPDEIPDVIAPILTGEADLVIGSRFMGRHNNVARYRRFGIGVITLLYNAGARTRITDGQSCFRAYNRRALETLHITEPGFGFSVETLVQARSAGLRIRETSISCVYHDESHSMNPVLHGVEVALMVMKHRGLAAINALSDSTRAT